MNLHTIPFLIVERCSPTFEFKSYWETGMWWGIAHNFMRLEISTTFETMQNYCMDVLSLSHKLHNACDMSEFAVRITDDVCVS
jgi:hypothetical protein